MGAKAEEFRANARRLEERADVALEERIRLALLSVAQRWRDDIERYEFYQTATRLQKTGFRLGPLHPS